MLPGGVIGKGDLSRQAAITKTLLLPGGVIGKGNLCDRAAITKTLLLPGGIIGISRLSKFVTGFLKTLRRALKAAPETFPVCLPSVPT